jgi:hypothetical protein
VCRLHGLNMVCGACMVFSGAGLFASSLVHMAERRCAQVGTKHTAFLVVLWYVSVLSVWDLHTAGLLDC